MNISWYETNRRRPETGDDELVRSLLTSSRCHSTIIKGTRAEQAERKHRRSV
jgi:hypothetical protein